MAEERYPVEETETERTPRESREDAYRPSDAWVPPSILPTPKPQDGWVFRWVRTSMFEKADTKNVSKRFREGWTPCRAEDHTELHIQSDIDSRFEGNIEVGGLLLCKAPEEKVRQRREYYEKMALGQMEAVDDNYMREQDSRMPLFKDRKSRTTFGGS